jgi:hypothetical protein
MQPVLSDCIYINEFLFHVALHGCLLRGFKLLFVLFQGQFPHLLSSSAGPKRRWLERGSHVEKVPHPPGAHIGCRQSGSSRGYPAMACTSPSPETLTPIQSKRAF